MMAQENTMIRPPDNYQNDQLLDDGACQMCYSRAANIQCRPCMHIICCHVCVLPLCTQTYVHNRNRYTCPNCNQGIDDFVNTDTGQRITPGTIQDEHVQDVYLTRDLQRIDQSEQPIINYNDSDYMDDPNRIDTPEPIVDEENAHSDDPEYAEDGYRVGPLDDDDRRIIRTVAELQRSERAEYIPGQSDDEVEDLPIEYDDCPMAQGSEEPIESNYNDTDDEDDNIHVPLSVQTRGMKQRSNPVSNDDMINEPNNESNDQQTDQVDQSNSNNHFDRQSLVREPTEEYRRTNNSNANNNNNNGYNANNNNTSSNTTGSPYQLRSRRTLKL